MTETSIAAYGDLAQSALSGEGGESVTGQTLPDNGTSIGGTGAATANSTTCNSVGPNGMSICASTTSASEDYEAGLLEDVGQDVGEAVGGD